MASVDKKNKEYIKGCITVYIKVEGSTVRRSSTLSSKLDATKLEFY